MEGALSDRQRSGEKLDDKEAARLKKLGNLGGAAMGYLPPESERQIRIGTVFPRSLPKIVKQEPNKGVLPSTGNAPPLLLAGTVRPSRVLRLSRAKRR